MTEQEIRDAIVASSALQALVPDTVALAAALSVGRVRLQKCFTGVGRIMDTLGPPEGASVLDTLDSLKATVPAIKWAFILLERGELDVGLVSVRSQIDALTPAVFSVEQAAALKALAEIPDPIAEFDVRKAIFSDNGDLLV